MSGKWVTSRYGRAGGHRLGHHRVKAARKLAGHLADRAGPGSAGGRGAQRDDCHRRPGHHRGTRPEARGGCRGELRADPPGDASRRTRTAGRHWPRPGQGGRSKLRPPSRRGGAAAGSAGRVRGRQSTVGSSRGPVSPSATESGSAGPTKTGRVAAKHARHVVAAGGGQINLWRRTWKAGPGTWPSGVRLPVANFSRIQSAFRAVPGCCRPGK